MNEAEARAEQMGSASKEDDRNVQAKPMTFEEAKAASHDRYGKAYEELARPEPDVVLGTPPKAHVGNLNPNSIVTTEEFDAALPDEFWTESR
jgi:hypothetical protein